MRIDFEKLEQIDEINETVKAIFKLINPEKRWLSTKELSQYIPYSVETINKKVQHGEFECGVHFHKKNKTNIFDKEKIDEWIINNELSDKYNSLKNQIIERMTLDLK